MARNSQIDDLLLSAIDAAAAQAYGSDTDGELSSQRAEAIDRYVGRNIYPSPEGTSQVVDRSTFDTVSWILPSLIRIFTSSPELVAFDPIGPEDEAQAEQESAYVSHVIQQQNDWFQVVHDWFMDALLTKNGYCMAWYDDSESFDKETYEGLSDEQMAMLAGDDEVEIVQHSQYPDEQAKPQQVMDPMTGQPVMAPPPNLHDVVLRRKKRNGRVRLEVLPPERVLVGHRTRSWRLRDCDYFEYWDYTTISDLRAQGYDVPDDIGDQVGGTGDTEEDNARNLYDESNAGDDPADSDPSMRRVKARTVWIRYDLEGNGIATLHRVVVVGREILDRRDVSRITVSCITPSPLPHRHMGLSIDDIVKDLQEIKTQLLRQGLNSLYLSNFPRIAATERVNLDDLLDVRAGGVIRVEDGGVPGSDMMPITIPNSFPQALQGLEYVDSIRQNRTGVNSYFSGLDQNSLGTMNRTASGIAQLTSSASQRVEQIARVFGSGVEELFSIVHQLILEHGHQQEVVRLRGQWKPIDPRQWRTRSDLRINVGMGTGNREQVLAHMQQIFGVQMQVGPMGLVKPDHLFNTVSELVKAAGFSSAEKFFADPSKSPPPPPPPPDPRMLIEQERLRLEGVKIEIDKARAQQAWQRESTDAQRESANEVMAAQINLLKAELDRYKADLDASTKINIAAMSHQAAAEQAAAKAGIRPMASNGASIDDVVQAAADNTIQGLRNDQQQQMAAMLSSLQQQAEMMRGLIGAMAAPRELVRDPATGKVTGMRPVIQPPEGQIQ